MATNLIIGEGRLKICPVHSEGKTGLLITPVEEAHEVGEPFPEEGGKVADIRENSIVIWVANVEGVRVLQDAVNSVALFMTGCAVVDRPEGFDPRTHELVKTSELPA